MQVIATEAAFYGGNRVRPGDKLDVPDNFKASWFVKAKAHKVAPEPAKQEPVALSQVGKDGPKTFNDVHGKANDIV